MTKDNYMSVIAEPELDKFWATQLKPKIRRMVSDAFSSGIKSAELESIERYADELKEILRKDVEEKKPDENMTNLLWNKISTTPAYIPMACRDCPNHPTNGGSGICNCTMGTETVP